METHVLCRVEDVPTGGMKGCTLPDGRAIAVYNVEGTFFASDDLCTHGQASLSAEGFLDGYVVECAWHLGAFDVRTGAPVAPPCEVALRTYPVTVKDDRVCIALHREEQ